MSVPAGDILRGMEVERQPMCVGRPRAAAAVTGPVESTASAMRRHEEEAGVEEARREAQRAGYEEGHRQGLADAAAHAAEAADRAVSEALAPLRQREEQLAALAASLAAARNAWLEAAEDDMVALCFETVCRLVAGCALEPDAVRALLRSHAATLAEEETAAIHLHPQDAKLLQGDCGASVRVLADPHVSLGGCIVRHAAGGLDARLETMLGACKEALLSVRASRSAEVRP